LGVLRYHSVVNDWQNIMLDISVNTTSGDIIWATPFIAHGTVLNTVIVPDNYDWVISWGSSISRISLQSTSIKFLHQTIPSSIGHTVQNSLAEDDSY
jgi:hypothetical protein